MFCAIFQHLYNFKKRGKHLWRSITFSLQIKSNTPPWMFLMFFKLYKWYQIEQSIYLVRPCSWTCSCNGAFLCNSQIGRQLDS